MGNAVYPDLPGLDIAVTKRPAFSTGIQRSVSGHEARVAFQAYPTWSMSLVYNVLRSGAERELQAIVGFFLARRGAWDSFLFLDPDDSAVIDQAIGLGDGLKTQFQLFRSYGYGAGAVFDEPVHNVASIGNIKLAGAPTTAYTLNSTGLVTFTAAPAVDVAVTWSGTFYHRCRFAEDEMDFDRFMQGLWEARSVEFLGSPMNKV